MSRDAGFITTLLSCFFFRLLLFIVRSLFVSFSIQTLYNLYLIFKFLISPSRRTITSKLPDISPNIYFGWGSVFDNSGQMSRMRVPPQPPKSLQGFSWGKVFQIESRASLLAPWTRYVTSRRADSWKYVDSRIHITQTSIRLSNFWIKPLMGFEYNVLIKNKLSRYHEESSFSKLSVTSPTSQLILILQALRHFTYVTAHSPTLPSLYLRHI